MIDHNRKRYVYLDKYLEYQNTVAKELKKLDNKVHVLTIIIMGSIGVLTALLYKIFG
jgi:hypothetical protein